MSGSARYLCEEDRIHNREVDDRHAEAEYPVYDDVAYEVMIKDERRMNRYVEAVRRYAPGRTVLDIGTGKDAVWAPAAARAGARHVWAVEVIPTSARIARETIEEAGFADRITVIEGLSTEIELPEPVDLCVSEIIGAFRRSSSVMWRRCSPRWAAPLICGWSWRGCRTARRCGSGRICRTRPRWSRWSSTATWTRRAPTAPS
ncbi:hypothetical protein Z951_38860 [Streptomyces sp. PRh5]|uniref:SAM-dependent methyltransferase n=1 Tax=Streptomyces sp. PRh5 TaxID=1158056 RepID=UPI00044A5038|nr:SAM-dependent methyltransferase [Streptomyces sp. PRh5]EXU62907.1 hypothetical protein Z951_38860 [Streptomyces sp. PRh5]